MRLIRLGSRGQEKPGALDANRWHLTERRTASRWQENRRAMTSLPQAIIT